MTASAKMSDQGVPLGNASPDEPAHTVPSEPSHVTQVRASPDGAAGGSSGPAPKNPGNEEPPLALEPDLPSDGRDEVGEAMIRELPQRPELSEPPSQPDPSNQTP
jgi:hypothetical protein